MSDENDENTEARDVIDFNVNDARIAKVAKEFEKIDATVDLKAAKAAKQTLVKMRTALGDAHKIQKADSLAFGRRLDGEKNRLLALIEVIETPIGDQLKEIKEAEERKEQDRIDAINNEIERIRAFPADRHDLTLEQLEERRTTLATIKITEEVFQEYLDQAQIFHDEADAKLRIAIINETERLAEEKRKAEQAEADRIRQEEMDAQQRKLDEQAEEQRKATELAEENTRAENEKRVEAERVEQEKKDKARQDELDAQAETQRQEKADLEAKQKEIDDENARLAQEKSDAEKIEHQKIADQAAEDARLAAAPDVEKLARWTALLNTQLQPIELTTDAAKRIQTIGMEKLEGVITYIKTESEKLK